MSRVRSQPEGPGDVDRPEDGKAHEIKSPPDEAPAPVTMPLTHAANAPIALVGGKAASLGRLLAHGLPAPGYLGIVVLEEV